MRDFVFPMFRANALYEGVYLLGTSIARPLIAKHLVEIAQRDRRRRHRPRRHRQGQRPGPLRALRLCARTPTSRSSRPGATGTSRSRTDLHRLRREAPDPGAKDKRGEAPFSVDANLLHSSSEGKVLEDPWREPPDYVYQRTISPEDAPDKPTYDRDRLREGRPGRDRRQAAVARRRCSPQLNDLGRDNGIGRLDLVENRFVGMKSRGVYETPGGTILLAAHRAIESITLDRGPRISRTS